MLVANLDREMESENDILIGVAILVGRNEKWKQIHSKNHQGSCDLMHLGCVARSYRRN